MMHALTRTAPGHVLQHADARLKILVGAGLLALVTASGESFVFPLALAAASLVLCLSLRVPAKTLAFRFAEPLLLAGLFVLIKLFSGQGAPLFHFEVCGLPFAGSREGLREGTLLAGRMLAAVSVVVALGSATKVSDFLAALAWFKVPRGFVEVLVFAHRAFFVLLEDAAVIYGAQRNRLGYVNVRRGLASFGALAGALTVKAFENSEAMATAMRQRGFDGTLPLAGLPRLRLGETAVSLLILLAAGGLWTLR